MASSRRVFERFRAPDSPGHMYEFIESGDLQAGDQLKDRSHVLRIEHIRAATGDHLVRVTLDAPRPADGKDEYTAAAAELSGVLVPADGLEEIEPPGDFPEDAPYG